MALPVQKIEEEIRTLSPSDKANLLRTLIADLDAEVDEDVEQAWLKEAQRRHQELAHGVVQAVPSEEVFKKARSLLEK